jgi:hypothetical protein
MIKRASSFLLLLLALVAWVPAGPTGQLKVAPNGRYLMTASGQPFFWLGDTGWLLFNKLKREEAETYLEDRRKKGFNVIRVRRLGSGARQRGAATHHARQHGHQCYTV